jgi:hypothetical protein
MIMKESPPDFLYLAPKNFVNGDLGFLCLLFPKKSIAEQPSGEPKEIKYIREDVVNKMVKDASNAEHRRIRADLNRWTGMNLDPGIERWPT